MRMKSFGRMEAGREACRGEEESGEDEARVVAVREELGRPLAEVPLIEEAISIAFFEALTGTVLAELNVLL